MATLEGGAWLVGLCRYRCCSVSGFGFSSEVHLRYPVMAASASVLGHHCPFPLSCAHRHCRCASHTLPARALVAGLVPGPR
eukprot:734297-Pleurochrysis_carterae.AAC.2